ncbi:hypothetical protein B0T17DRAFT_616176 [Bombardia bombarda]|uniref:Rhodopsin domain-containing protein n=1 Tax=Bombardia bombarda TaxID=252184 RepID=A0AA39XAV8_9PEZI|nr:hypothetical protein B0T17DRAFT_616176 [Bombardia bombarda]
MADPLANFPAMVPPPGEVSNFIDPYSLAPAGRIVVYVTLPLMVISVALRIYTRLFVTRTIGTDDYLCVAAAAAVVSYCAVTLSVFGGGYLGPHQWNVRLTSITPDYIKGAIVITCLYSASALFIKASLFVFYLRIFRPSTLANIMIWTGLVLVVLFYVICIITTSVFCNPTQWSNSTSQIDFLIKQGSSNCNHPQLNLSAAQGVFSTLSDIYLLSIPIIFISTLELPLRRKVGICGIFLVGLLATGCSIATLTFRFQQRNSEDFSWFSALNIILGTAELNAGVICACIPVAFVIFKRITSTPGLWVSSLRQYLRSATRGRLSRRNQSATVVGKDGEGSEYATKEDYHLNKLPNIPRATITGLGTFVRGGKNQQSTELTQMSGLTTGTYAEIGTVEEEYHQQLKRFESSSTTAAAAPQSRRGERQTTPGGAVTPKQSHDHGTAS